MELENFTPVSATVGGVLIGFAAMLLMALLGRIAGISGLPRTWFRLESRAIGHAKKKRNTQDYVQEEEDE